MDIQCLSWAFLNLQKQKILHPFFKLQNSNKGIDAVSIRYILYHEKSSVLHSALFQANVNALHILQLYFNHCFQTLQLQTNYTRPQNQTSVSHNILITLQNNLVSILHVVILITLQAGNT